jgi:hypothetical protein
MLLFVICRSCVSVIPAKKLSWSGCSYFAHVLYTMCLYSYMGFFLSLWNGIVVWRKHETQNKNSLLFIVFETVLCGAMCPVISRLSEICTTSTMGLDLFNIAVTCNVYKCKNLHVIYSRSQVIINKSTANFP